MHSTALSSQQFQLYSQIIKIALLVHRREGCRGGRGEGGEGEVGICRGFNNWDSVEIKVGEKLSEDDDDNKEHGEPEKGEAPAKDWEAGRFPVSSLPCFGLSQRAREVRMDLKAHLVKWGQHACLASLLPAQS